MAGTPYIEITEEDLTRVNGQWLRDDRGWWYQKGDGTYTSNGWQYINYKWYFFDQEGYMKTGWISWEDKLYYCDPSGPCWYLRSHRMDLQWARMGPG